MSRFVTRSVDSAAAVAGDAQLRHDEALVCRRNQKLQTYAPISLEAVIEEANEALARVVFQRVEDFVNHHPAGLVLPYPDDERAKAFPLRAQKKGSQTSFD